jgi:hypothetical protein
MVTVGSVLQLYGKIYVEGLINPGRVEKMKAAGDVVFHSAFDTAKALNKPFVLSVLISVIGGVGCALATITQSRSLNLIVAKRITLAFGGIAATIFALGFFRFCHQMPVSMSPAQKRDISLHSVALLALSLLSLWAAKMLQGNTFKDIIVRRAAQVLGYGSMATAIFVLAVISSIKTAPQE